MIQNHRLLGLAGLCLLFLTAFRYPTVLERAPAAVPASFVFKDGRPAKQLKSGFESLMITNCAYGSTRIGARDLDPDPLLLIQDMLVTRMNPVLAGREVTLKNFTLHLNNSVGLRAMMGQMYTGLIPGMMNDQQKVGCAPDDLRGGFIVNEIETGKTPLVVVMDVQVDQQAFHARCLQPFATAYPAMKRADPAVKAEWNRNVGQAVSCALDQIGQQIAQVFSPTNAISAPATEEPASGDPLQAPPVQVPAQTNPEPEPAPSGG